MKKILFFLFLSLLTCSVAVAQGPSKKCPACGVSIAKCPYKGKHPKPTQPTPPKEKTCVNCGKPISKCPYNGNHPAPEAAGYDVTFTCNVSSALLAIDGNASGTASGTRFLKTGNHSVKVTANGYNDYNATITVNRQNTSYRFTLEKKPDPVVTTSGTANGHEWIDLGLPSGTKWATMNVGASSPSDYGNYYAWGETSTKSSYTWENLKYRTSGDSYDNVKFSKYVTDRQYGSVDGKKELDPSDDAAYVNWGSGWRMPSRAQQDELREKCKWTWTSQGGWAEWEFSFLARCGLS